MSKEHGESVSIAVSYTHLDVYKRQSQESMTRALHAVREGELTPNAAAQRYGIPRRTLRRYILEKNYMKSKLGRKAVLNSDQEKELCKRIFRLADVGYPLTSKIVRLCVFRSVSYTHLTIQGCMRNII